MPFKRLRVTLIFSSLLLVQCNCTENGDPIPPARFTMDRLIGVNAFVDDPVNLLEPFGFVREYHNWEWDDEGLYPHNKIKWAPGIWDFDEYYTQVSKAGIEIAPCLKENVKWLKIKTNNRSDKPLDEPGANTTDPNSYETKAHHMFQFAARYGSTAVAHTKLTLASTQVKKSAMGLVGYLEDWNEQNKTWEGEDAYFSPQEYAAMLSADYDGHANTMHQGSGTFGVKNADPKLKMVMGGLAGVDLDYIRDMKKWFENNRSDRKFAADVINFHIYGFRSDKGWQGGGPAISPEKAKFKKRMRELTSYRDKYLPGVEVWVSEFGWDTNPASPLCPPRIGNFDIEEVQALWIVRSYLEFAAAGVDRAQVYMLRDVDPKSPVWYASSGLTGPKGNWQPKKSWYYVATLRNALKGMKFNAELLSKNEDVRAYEFKRDNSSDRACVVWSGTSDGISHKRFELKLPTQEKEVEVIEMLPGKVEGRCRKLKINAGVLKIDVTERPVYIRYQATP